MHYLDFYHHFQKFASFSAADIRRAEPAFNLRQLNYWMSGGLLQKICRGHYRFTDRALNETILLTIANRLYEPSYISLETALSHHGLIPESVYNQTSVTSRKTQTLKTPLGSFIYRHLSPRLFFGYTLGAGFKLAEPEKAVLDYLYLNPLMRQPSDFYEWRLNPEVFKELINLDKLESYLRKFNSHATTARVRRQLKYLKL